MGNKSLIQEKDKPTKKRKRGGDKQQSDSVVIPQEQVEKRRRKKRKHELKKEASDEMSAQCIVGASGSREPQSDAAESIILEGTKEGGGSAKVEEGGVKKKGKCSKPEEKNTEGVGLDGAKKSQERPEKEDTQGKIEQREQEVRKEKEKQKKKEKGMKYKDDQWEKETKDQKDKKGKKRKRWEGKDNSMTTTAAPKAQAPSKAKVQNKRHDTKVPIPPVGLTNKSAIHAPQNATPINTNWAKAVAQLQGGDTRKSKFLRLLGAKSASTTQSMQAEDNHIITKREAELEKQFNTSMLMKTEPGFKRRGLGA